MSKEIRNFLLIYILPICVLCLVFVFFAPALFAKVVLGMVCGVALLVMAMSLVIDWMDRR